VCSFVDFEVVSCPQAGAAYFIPATQTLPNPLVTLNLASLGALLSGSKLMVITSTKLSHFKIKLFRLKLAIQ